MNLEIPAARTQDGPNSPDRTAQILDEARPLGRFAHHLIGPVSTAYTRSWAVDSMNGRVRSKAENDRLRQKVGELLEPIQIKDLRMA